MAWSYDLIAAIYETDMGQSMQLDDVGWYTRLCKKKGGRALELGCGTGRILRSLLNAGIDAIGIDRSLPMLQQLRAQAAAEGVSARVAQMDMRALALIGTFHVIMAPYSLITYLSEPNAINDFFIQTRPLLENEGYLVLDAFIPQPVMSFADFRLDYQRRHGDGQLERHKRISVLSDGRNRIERRYRLYDQNQTLREEISTEETIRPYTVQQLEQIAALHHYSVVLQSWDYGTRDCGENAKFATLVVKPDR